MKKKWMASTALACSCMLLISGCSGNKADDFDAVAYTTAYLDGMIRGNVDTLSSLSGVSSDDLTATFNSMIDDLVSSSIGGDGSSPGSTQISPHLRHKESSHFVLKNALFQEEICGEKSIQVL